MRARVRKQNGGHEPARDESRPSSGTATSDSDDTGGRNAVEVTKSDEGQGGALPPWPALVAATIPKGVHVLSPMSDPAWTWADGWTVAKSTLVVLDADADVINAVELARAAQSHGNMLVGYQDDTAARDAFAAVTGLNMFKVAGAPGRLFGATYELTFKADWLEKIEHEVINTDKTMQIVKSDEVADERIVYGIVLEPDGVDSQNDTISPDEIRQAAHKFMQDYGNVGLQHQTYINGKARVLESFIAPADFTLDDQDIKKGTWVMSMRVLDDDIWKAVKSGLITGFSIGGTAVRKPTAIA